MSQSAHPEPNPQKPDIDNRDWGECGIVLYEQGNTEGWIQVSEDGLVDVER